MGQLSSVTVAPRPSHWLDRFSTPLLQALLVCVLVFAASLFGILTRPVGFLAAFWPANAILLGVMVRYPVLNSPWSWIGAIVGYCAADLLTGSDWFKTTGLTAANLAGVTTGVVLLSRLSVDDRHLRRPLSVLFLLASCAASGVAAALPGAWAGPLLFGKSWLTSFGLWLVTEMVNYILLLPVILTAPRLSQLGSLARKFKSRIRQHPIHALPILVLLISMAGSILMGGPGAVMFSIPALLWCALTYDLFATAVATMLYCVWMLIAVSTGAIFIHQYGDYIYDMVSIRMGISLLALGPLTASSINAAREEVLRNLDHAVNHDFLTDALARRAFIKLGDEMVTGPFGNAPTEDRRRPKTGEEHHPAVLMLDIDHFKQVNDRHGHQAGDQVLVAFANRVAALLRPEDLFGRLGGEEFAIILSRVTAEDAVRIAERLRARIEAEPATIASGEVIPITVSIGLVCPRGASPPSLDALLSAADQALYRSKREGRNRVTTVLIPTGTAAS